MAVRTAEEVWPSGHVYRVELGAEGDVWLAPMLALRGWRLVWETGEIGWRVPAGVRVEATLDPAAADKAVYDVADDWFTLSDGASAVAATRRDPIAGLRLKAARGAPHTCLVRTVVPLGRWHDLDVVQDNFLLAAVFPTRAPTDEQWLAGARSETARVWMPANPGGHFEGFAVPVARASPNTIRVVVGLGIANTRNNYLPRVGAPDVVQTLEGQVKKTYITERGFGQRAGELEYLVQ